MLFNEPKLLKYQTRVAVRSPGSRFSALQRAEIAEIVLLLRQRSIAARFSALQRAEIAEIRSAFPSASARAPVSVLFNEPKLLKSICFSFRIRARTGFSALQRAEIAEIAPAARTATSRFGFSALQRAEIAEIGKTVFLMLFGVGFSALQRAEIAEIPYCCCVNTASQRVSVLFNEPKLLKFRAGGRGYGRAPPFQCSSTSRNC